MKRQFTPVENRVKRHPIRNLLLISLSTFIIACYSEQSRQMAAISKATPAVKRESVTLKNWGLQNFRADSHIHALDAWTLNKGDRKVIVAVIDTGIDPSHPDLQDNIWRKKSSASDMELAKNAGGVQRQNATSSNDTQNLENEIYSLKQQINRLPLKRFQDRKKRSQLQNRYLHLVEKLEQRRWQQMPEYGWDFVSGQANPKDHHGHGTHVAGIIGGVLNRRFGAAGVAQQVSIMAVRYYDESNSGSVNLTNSIKALHYAIDNGARIINYSGGGPEFSKDEYDAIRRAEEKGILLVAAAGNEKSDIDLAKNYYYPSAYGLSNIISVAATDIENQLLRSSNWGKKKVDIAAPGENIYSTLPGQGESKQRYGIMSGTSQATAFVTGLAALMLSENPDLSPQQIKEIIVNSVDKFSHLSEKVASGGRINAYKTLVALREKSGRPVQESNPSQRPNVTQLQPSVTGLFQRLTASFQKAKLEESEL